MLCLWQHGARIASWKALYPSLKSGSSRIVRTFPFSLSPAQHASVLLHIPRSPIRHMSAAPSLLTNNSPQQYQLYDPVPMYTPSSVKPLQPPVMEQSLTPAQTSRAASSAIHHSLRNGRLADAYLILNSIRYANTVKSKPTSVKVPWTRLSIDDFARVAIQFEQVVPMRLPWHALIHDLLRLGLSKKAAKLTRELMQNGIKIRRKTFEVVMESVTRSSGLLPNRTAFIERVIDTREILQLGSSMANDGTTRFALQLLEIADTHRNERSRSMFNKLIILCIINGEIILASLLYGFMARSEKKKHADEVASAASADRVDGVDIEDKFSRHFHYNNAEFLRPSPTLLARMCKLIEKKLVDDSASKLEARSALQALTNLAQLVDHDQLSVGIAPLLKTMRSIPQTKYRTWTRDASGAPKLVHGSSYIHGVCDKLVKELAMESDAVLNAEEKHDSTPSPMPTRKLHRNARNALLNQYICRKLPISPILKLLEAETNQSEPHVDSMNILLKATHLRDESAKALDILQLDGPPKIAIMKLAKRLVRDSNPHPILYDTYTVVAYVKKAAAMHDLRALKTLVFELFPELRNDYHATTHSQMSRERALKAASLGPYIITTMLQVLCYTRDYERAHRLWCLSKVAQYTSWKPDTPPTIKPWRLPIQAYTIMVQCYARKADQKCSNLTWETSPTEHLAYYRRSSRQLIMDLYRSMDFKKPYHKPSPAVQTPEPDLLFFKTLLKALAPPVDIRFKTVKEREDYFRHRIKISEVEYARYGRVYEVSPPEVHEIMEDMLLEQFSIPLEYRYLFVGRR